MVVAVVDNMVVTGIDGVGSAGGLMVVLVDSGGR